eukprot:TRINITY_DN9523_c0_g1_i3.p1 TRINITY_DN9523_c0_g1~~TRINITY_DN9523_c0_g1_i3.p1  ORF type:complete len:408 (-),score=128.09 TRINITY_DN9523_c0_g1_i3:946-2169(-)
MATELVDAVATLTAPYDQPNRLKWDLSAAQILELADATIVRGRAVYDQVAAVTEATFANTLQVIADYDSYAEVLGSMCTFPKDTSADKEIREASTEATNLINKACVECSMRFDVYEVIKQFGNTDPALAGEEKRLLDRALRDYRRNGMDLEEAQRDHVKQIKEKMSELGTQYSTNSNEENTTLEFTAAELTGLPSDFLESHKTSEDQYTLSLKYPDYIPVMQLCSVSETRRKMELAYNSRNNPQNATILEQLIELRAQQAGILGYDTHAHYVLETRMSKSPDVVKPFLSDLSAKLGPLWAQEEQALLKYKQQVCEQTGEAYEPCLHNWDLQFYRYMVTVNDFSVDHEQIKQYFPLQHVTAQLLQIYQELLGLRFVEEEGADVWHPDVKLFCVYNSDEEGELVGKFCE